MADRWYISDHHLGHYNILKYGERPFKTLPEMHDALVQFHNELVKPQDHVSFLGDLTMKRGGRLDKEWIAAEIRRYNGHKRLYLGNHDHMSVKHYIDACGFEKVYATWRSEEGFISSHFPLHPRSLGSATANVHGHIHQNKAYDPIVFEANEVDRGQKGRREMPRRVLPYINVSVEAVNYRPVHLDTILQIIRRHNEGATN
jgi:calcineurin-like phosphoesterase family protein